MPAGDDLPHVRFRGRFAKHLPLFGGYEVGACARGIGEPGFQRLRLGKLGVGYRTIRLWREDAAVSYAECRWICLQLFSGQFDENLTGRRGCCAHARHGSRRRSTARSATVVGALFGIAHDEAHVLDRQPQFLGGGLTQLRSGTLSHFDLAGQHRNRTVDTDDNTITNLGRATSAIEAGTACGNLGSPVARGDRDKHPQPENSDEHAARMGKIVARAHGQFEAFVVDRLIGQ